MNFLTTTIAFLLMFLFSVSQCKARDVSQKVDPQALYLFYLHGYIVEAGNTRPTSPKFGTYEYEEILKTFEQSGFVVISEARKQSSEIGPYASKVAEQVKQLLNAGVPPQNITIVGASQGSWMTMLVSTFLKNRSLNFVAIGACAADDGLLKLVDLHGNVLFISEKSDLPGSCQRFRADATGLSEYKEVETNTGQRHGFLYRPMKEWVAPTIAWAKTHAKVSAGAGNGQTNKTANEPLLVVPGKFKLLTKNVSYRGESCSPHDKTDEIYSASSGVIRVGDDVYYQGHRFYRGDGLMAENLAAKTCHFYPMFGLAEAAGWFKPKKDGPGTPNATRGLFRVGNSLWMGSDGIGIAVFDLKRKTWSRYDFKSAAVPGDHVGVDYADDNYVFVTGGEFPHAASHIYSVKQNRWLGLKAVSTELVREFGYTTEMVQIAVDHRIFAKKKYLPVDWTLMYPKITPANNGESYLFQRTFSVTRTVFEISKAQLDRVFMKPLAETR